MNKKVGDPGGRLSQLESDMNEKEGDRENAQNRETGARQNAQKTSQFKREAETHARKFMYKVGKRMRHPDNVLHQFAGVDQGTSKASTLWEEALQHETKRADMPDALHNKGDGDGMASQVGIVPISRQNHKWSKNKLGATHLVGV